MNLIPLVSSNLRAARISPMLPSLIRSASDTPWFWYFFATATTKRRFERTRRSSDSLSPALIRLASLHSSSRSISGYTLISRRYWSSDSDSAGIFLGGLNDIGCSGENGSGRPFGEDADGTRERAWGGGDCAPDRSPVLEHGKAAERCQPLTGTFFRPPWRW